jgi:hypothetical protein
VVPEVNGRSRSSCHTNAVSCPECASTLPGAPTVCVLNLNLTSKFIMRIPGFGGCARWAQALYSFGKNVPTSSHRWPALLTPLMIKTRSKGYKRAKD